jgi:hypothetical protein
MIEYYLRLAERMIIYHYALFAQQPIPCPLYIISCSVLGTTTPHHNPLPQGARTHIRGRRTDEGGE